MSFPRARGLGETYRLARAAGERAGVTRVADISGLAGMGLPAFQAVRPQALSLTVSQGKGGSALAARVAALLEACELACAESLPKPEPLVDLATMPGAVQQVWAGNRPDLSIDLDPALPRAWVTGRVLGSDAPMPMPWDLLNLDFTRAPLEYPAGSDGLATGNTRAEAVFAAICELVEYDQVARFEALTPLQRRALQIDVASIDDPVLSRELQLISAAGFVPRLWSIGQALGIPVIACKILAAEPALDHMTPTGGSGCHPDRASAAFAAVREAVQSRAALVAGARDDIVDEDYSDGRNRALGLTVSTLAVGEGPLPWPAVPAINCGSVEAAITVIREAIARLTPLPVVILDHDPPVTGLSVVHALAPGLLNLSRRSEHGRRRASGARLPSQHSQPRRAAVLFAGPSIAGLDIPDAIELRPPAVCGDLARLLADPPAAVGLIDGHFGIAPTVWHKEILDLLAHGVRVLGAASIGALRAAELEAMGMEGVGAIFEAYRDGTIERDDAVMVLQAPAEFAFAPLTLPLVDAEHTIAALRCTPRERRMMQRIARTMPYELRSWERCLAAYRARTGEDFSVPAGVLAAAASLKQKDAALLVERLQAAGREPAGARLTNPPPPTNHYLRMLARTAEGAVRDLS